MMRLLPALLAFALLATACSSDVLDEVASSGDSSSESEVAEESSGNTTAPTVAEAEEEEPFVVEGLSLIHI